MAFGLVEAEEIFIPLSELDSWEGFLEAYKTFRPISVKDYKRFAPYFQEWDNMGRYPRYFQSVTMLLASPGVYLSGVISGCLVIVKRRMIHNNPIFYLIMPPMSICGDIWMEEEIIRAFQKLNISTKLSDEDFERYHISQTAIKNDDAPEFIYDSETYIELKGKAFTSERNEINKINRMVLNLTIIKRNELRRREHSQLTSVVLDWEEHKGATAQTRLLKTILHNSEQVQTSTLWKDGVCLGYSFTERLSSGHACILSRIRNYKDRTIHDPSMYLHYMDCHHHTSSYGPTLMNIGNAENKGKERGLYSNKMKLHPVKVLDIFTLKTPSALTREQWDQTRK